MTPDEREELARTLMGRQVGRSVTAEIWCMVDEQHRKNWLRFVDAIAPILDRLVAERVAAETERCAGIAREHDDPPTNDYGQGWRDAAQSIAAAIRQATSV